MHKALLMIHICPPFFVLHLWSVADEPGPRVSARKRAPLKVAIGAIHGDAMARKVA